MTASLFVRHAVKDLTHWLYGYKTRTEAGLLEEYGIIAESVHTDLNGGSTVIVMHQFADEAALNAFKALFDSELFRTQAANDGGIFTGYGYLLMIPVAFKLAQILGRRAPILGTICLILGLGWGASMIPAAALSADPRYGSLFDWHIRSGGAYMAGDSSRIYLLSNRAGSNWLPANLRDTTCRRV